MSSASLDMLNEWMQNLDRFAKEVTSNQKLVDELNAATADINAKLSELVDALKTRAFVRPGDLKSFQK